MKESVHKILSDIHRLLSESTADQLREAAGSSTGSLNLETALNALANERSGGPSASPKNTSGRKTNPVPVRNQTHAHPIDSNSLEKLVSEAFKNRTKNEIVEQLKDVIPVSTNVKEERSRLLRRIARQLQEVNQDKRDLILREYLVKPDRQTEGWIEVINKSK